MHHTHELCYVAYTVHTHALFRSHGTIPAQILCELSIVGIHVCRHRSINEKQTIDYDFDAARMRRRKNHGVLLLSCFSNRTFLKFSSFSMDLMVARCYILCSILMLSTRWRLYAAFGGRIVRYEFSQLGKSIARHGRNSVRACVCVSACVWLAILYGYYPLAL